MPNSALLDTCTLIRLGGYPETLSDEARATIENAWYLFVSPISLWEIVFKHQIGKLELAQPPKEWFATLKHEYELQTIPLTDEVMTHAAELPLQAVVHKTQRELQVVRKIADAFADEFRNDQRVVFSDGPHGVFHASRIEGLHAAVEALQRIRRRMRIVVLQRMVGLLSEQAAKHK